MNRRDIGHRHTPDGNEGPRGELAPDPDCPDCRGGGLRRAEHQPLVEGLYGMFLLLEPCDCWRFIEREVAE